MALFIWWTNVNSTELTVDFFIFILSVFYSSNVECGSVGEYHTSWSLQWNEPSHEKTNNLCFRTGPTKNQHVQSQKQARSLKVWIKEEEELYYPCSENEGADQLRSYCDADLHLCISICTMLVFSRCDSYRFFQENLPGRHGTEPNFFHRHVVVGVQTVSVSLVVGVVDISISWVVGLIPRWIYFWWVS